MKISEAKLRELVETLIHLSESSGAGEVRSISIDEDHRPRWAVVFVEGTEATELLLAKIDREQVRPTLEQAIQAVEAIFEENAWKGGWEGSDIRRLLTSLTAQVGELDNAVYAFSKDRSEENMELVGSKAADVQGMAAMIADVAGCYPHGERINGHDTEGLTLLECLVTAGWDPNEAAAELRAESGER